MVSGAPCCPEYKVPPSAWPHTPDDKNLISSAPLSEMKVYRSPFKKRLSFFSSGGGGGGRKGTGTGGGGGLLLTAS